MYLAAAAVPLVWVYIRSDLALREVVVRNHRDAEVRELADQSLGFGTLNREQCRFVRDVAQANVGAALLRQDVVPILLDVRRVHDHHQLVFEAIHEAVVDERAFFGENARVLRLTGFECPYVVAGHTLYEGVPVRARDFEFAHVRDVEDADVLAHRAVLAVDAGRIGNGHLEAGERHHLGAERDVHVV